jgi:predicted ester cyclase
MMSAEQNKAVVLRFHEAFDQGDLDEMEKCFDTNATAHFPGMPGPLNTQAFKQLSATYIAAFPQGRSTVAAVVAEGDLVAVRGTYRGTHKGELLGIPATGKSFDIPWMSLSRVVGGKIVEHWANPDGLGIMQQLGIVPAPQA